MNYVLIVAIEFLVTIVGVAAFVRYNDKKA